MFISGGGCSAKLVSFLLQAKCSVIAKHLGVDLGNSVLVRNKVL
jgi:uncharacterized protein with ATP-grasp and redox domains